MKGFDTLKIKSAVKSHNKFNLDFTHLSTLDFGQILPFMCLELVPSDKFNVKGNFFSRLSPLVKPTYGKFRFNTVSAFVPSYQLADDAEAFFDGKTTWEGITPKIRYISVAALVDFASTVGTHVTLSSGESDGNDGYIVDSLGKHVKKYDYKFIDNAGVKTFLRFEGIAKYFMKVLNALGYMLPQHADMQSSSTWFTYGFGSKSLNAMPLLAFCKIYNDWMSQSQRFNTSALTSFLRSVKHNVTVTGYSSVTRAIDSSGLAFLLSNLLLCYENDYFLSAWQEPMRPIGSSDVVNFGTVPGTGVDSVSYSANDSSISQFVNNIINQRSLDVLKAFDNYVKRHNYAGSRAVQSIYARFGIKTEDYRSNYCHVIDTSSSPLQVGDVTAQASTNPNGKDVYLGDYAGKGIGSANLDFNFASSDYGYLISLAYFTVVPFNSYGYDKSVLRTEPYDFYNPEFDGIGAEPISFAELFTNPIYHDSDTTTDDSVYGFSERYNSYRFSRDKITGEFLDYHEDADMNVWHSGRLLNNIRRYGNMVAQSDAMVRMENHDSQFNRIFAVPDLDFDHFYVTAQFNVSAIRPMLSINQVPGFGEGDTVVPRNGNTIN